MFVPMATSDTNTSTLEEHETARVHGAHGRDEVVAADAEPPDLRRSTRTPKPSIYKGPTYVA